MSKSGKKLKKLKEKVEPTKLYSLKEAVSLLKETSYSKFDGTVDVAINLGVDPRHADQNVRGACSLPCGLGKKVRIVVFAKGQKAIEAQEQGVEFVGGDDLAKKISEGWLEFDQIIATPDMMAVVGRLGKILGPRGLMPNPKMGTVTFDVVSAIKESQAGRTEFRVEKSGIVHAPVGKVSMDVDSLAANIEATIDVLVKAKPSTSKGMYLKKMSVSATMGPGVKVDLAPYR
ncbi:MAG: 50S ribosomal protein L1 [Zetaproteobacteria bacterium]|nr:50S ribosomal protein L1 [Pseudobdellovibrionaceae bacterium]|tara:strand:- start:817 stop:1509 length:693 start_codon:yes stop_codon:yes gene_type:complete